MDCTRKISVIVPVYNTAPYLSKCLDSILSQDYGNLEVICVNDGSTDDSLSILNEYAQKDCRIVVYSQENKGLGATRNFGLRVAKGDYVSFVDSDDFLDQGLYSSFIKICADEDIDVFLFNGRTQYSESCFLNPRYFAEEVLNGATFDYKKIKLMFSGNISVCNKIFSLSYLKKIKLKFLENCILEDLPFTFSALINSNKLKLSMDMWYNYILGHPNSITSNIKSDVDDTFRVFREIKKYAIKAKLYDYFKYAIFQMEYRRCIMLLKFVKYEYKETYFNKAVDFLKSEMKLLDENIYTKLVDYVRCYNFLHNDFKNIYGLSGYLADEYHYEEKLPENLKFSIIVPIYNVEKYLSVCLRSISNQTYTDFEVICVNDGSTDNSGKIAEKYALGDTRFKVINQENKGLGGARNTGVKYAKGEYMIFLDSDDWLRYDALEQLYKYTENDCPDMLLVGFNMYFSYNLRLRRNNYLDFFKDRNVQSYKDVKDLIFQYSAAWMKVCRREYWLQNKLWFAEHMYYEDLVYNLKVWCLAQKISVVFENLVYYRIREGSIMQGEYTDKKIADLVYVYSEGLVEAKKVGDILPDYLNMVQGSITLHLSRMIKQEQMKFCDKLKENKELFDIFSYLFGV